MNPMLSDHRVPQQNVVQTWDNVARTYDEEEYWRALGSHAILSHLLQHMGDPTGKRIIEVGCGSGFMSLALARRGAQCAVLDISPEALGVARRAFEQAGMPPPECFLTNALDSGIPSHSFDVAWNAGVIEHFSDADKERLVREMIRITKPGGLVIILVPNAWCIPFQLAQACMKWRGRWPYGFEDDMSPRRLRRMCAAMGLRDIETYAFDPVTGIKWMRGGVHIANLLRINTVEHHCRRSLMGQLAILTLRCTS